ncbi:MAG: multicomponent Na+:H+ antiporter subunit E [Verrucomicrobiales bacterium]|jgi:multicomponent Na+:H+ antiporter subunit E
MYQALVFFLLLLTWVIFSGLLDPFHLSLGVLSCLVVTWMSSGMLFANRKVNMGERLRQLQLLVPYLAWLLWQIVHANVHILKLALTPGGPDEVRPQMVRFRTELKSDFAKFLLAQSITLTPGTVTVKIEGDEFLIHAISKFAADGLDGAMEQRIAAIFEPESLGFQEAAEGGRRERFFS